MGNPRFKIGDLVTDINHSTCHGVVVDVYFHQNTYDSYRIEMYEFYNFVTNERFEGHGGILKPCEDLRFIVLHAALDVPRGTSDKD